MGCGVVADYGHVPAIQSTSGLELVALYDPVEEALERIGAKAPAAARFQDQEAFFEAGLDAVVVASPAGAHRQNVLAAARAGCHVLCEKPISMTERESEEMIAAMEGARRMFLIGFVYRFSPVARQIKRWIDDGVIGQVRSLRLQYLWDLHGRWENVGDRWIESPRWRGRMLEGGPLVDCGVHQIDLARWWLGREVVRTSVAAAWVADYEAPDHVYLHMDHEGGAHALVEVSFTYGHTAREPAPIFQYHLIGEGGVIVYDRNGYRLEVRTGQETIVTPGASEKHFEGMHRAFADALATGDPGDFPSARDGLLATRIAREMTDSAIRRRA